MLQIPSGVLFLLNTHIASNTGPKPFKFEAMWLQDNSCATTVTKSWNLPTAGFPIFQIQECDKGSKDLELLSVW